MTIAPDGRVSRVQPLCDRLLPLTADVQKVDAYRQLVLSELQETVYPTAEGESQITLPVVAVG